MHASAIIRMFVAVTLVAPALAATAEGFLRTIGATNFVVVFPVDEDAIQLMVSFPDPIPSFIVPVATLNCPENIPKSGNSGVKGFINEEELKVSFTDGCTLTGVPTSMVPASDLRGKATWTLLTWPEARPHGRVQRVVSSWRRQGASSQCW